VKYFTCKPKKEAFCCFVERLSLLPSDVRRYKEEWESGGVLFPVFKGVIEKKWARSLENLFKSTEALVDIGDGLIAYLELQFFPLVPYEKELSEEFKAYLKERFGLKGRVAFRCPFLEGGNRCRIHGKQPLSCKRYPWSFTEIQTECLKCGEEPFSELGKPGYAPIEELRKEWEKEVKRRKKDFGEWHEFVRRLFKDGEVLSEVIWRLEELRRSGDLLNAMFTPN